MTTYENLTSCLYEKSYYDYNVFSDKLYKCNLPRVSNSDYCKCHDEKYAKENSQQVIELIQKQFIDAFETNSTLICIGYLFPEDIRLEGNITNFAYFDHATFLGRTFFDGVIFHKRTRFHCVKFNDDVIFGDLEFRDIVSFNFSSFKKSVYFEGIVCTSSFRLNWVKLIGGNFFVDDCEFNGISTLTGTVFDGPVLFFDTRFTSYVDFGSEFKKNVYFNNCTFFDEARFSQTQFNEEVYLKRNLFDKQAKVTFPSDLSKFSFLETDVGRIRFEDNMKLNFTTGKKIKKNTMYQIHDERLLLCNIVSEKSVKNVKKDDNEISDEKEDDPCESEKSIQDVKKEMNDAFDGKLSTMNEKIYNIKQSFSLESVLAVYRSLRESSEYHLRYEEAGNFFVKEFELKRIYQFKKGRMKKRNIFSRNLSLAGLYHIISNYGESYSKPLYITIGMLFFSAFYFASESFSNFSNISVESIGNSLTHAIGALLPFGKFEGDPIWLDYVLQYAVFPISGTSFIALKRKFERRLRH